MIHGRSLKLVTNRTLAEITVGRPLQPTVYGIVQPDLVYPFIKDGFEYVVVPDGTIRYDSDGSTAHGILVYIRYSVGDGPYYTMLNGAGMDYSQQIARETEERFRWLTTLEEYIRVVVDELVLSDWIMDEIETETFAELEERPEYSSLVARIDNVEEAIYHETGQVRAGMEQALAELEEERDGLIEATVPTLNAALDDALRSWKESVNVFWVASRVVSAAMARNSIPHDDIRLLLNGYL
jgi:hypothetical protein